MIFDVHAHLNFLKENKLKEIQRDKKIKIVISNSIDLKSIKKNLEISKKFSKIKTSAGLYPLKNLSLKEYLPFKKLILNNRKKIIALGEIGLDLYHTRGNFELQKTIFKKQLDLAKKLNLPVIIHTRKAEKESLEILKNYKDLRMILHCFSGNFKLVKEAINLGCFFSIPTNIVRNKHFQKMVGEVPKTKILTETDTPFLSPFKEKQNEPSFIKETIKEISKIWKINGEKVEKIIEANFMGIFGNNLNLT